MNKLRDVLFVFLGIAGLLACSHYDGPLGSLVHSYAGNVCASFAVYFIAKQVPHQIAGAELVAAFLALAAVDLFEVFDGFGIMSNTYDPWDLAANTAGIGIALTIDLVLKQRREVVMQKEKGSTQ
jgi:hypothetical protein